MKKGELEADTDKVMPEYRAQLDAERALKLSNGRDYSSDKFRNGDSSTSFGLTRGGSPKHYSSSQSSSSSDEDESRRPRSSSRRSKKKKKHKFSRDKQSTKSKEETDGPVPLSRFFGNLKS
ncbi:hypothetical protein Bca101_045066 [Brassica carinata]